MNMISLFDRNISVILMIFVCSYSQRLIQIHVNRKLHNDLLSRVNNLWYRINKWIHFVLDLIIDLVSKYQRVMCKNQSVNAFLNSNWIINWWKLIISNELKTQTKVRQNKSSETNQFVLNFASSILYQHQQFIEK